MKQAQAALEFLTTYGWALLIIVVVIAAILYYGVGNVRNSIPESCQFDAPGLTCGSTYAIANGSFAFEITNNFGKTINITKVICQFSTTENALIFKDPNPLDQSILPGKTAVIFCDSAFLPVNLSLNEKNLFKTKIIYVFDEQEPISKLVNGELVVPISNDESIFLTDYASSQIRFATHSPYNLS